MAGNRVTIGHGSIFFVSLLAAFALLALSVASPARAQDTVEAIEPSNSLWSRPSLFGGPGSAKEALRQHGIGIDVWWTQFNQRLVDGDGEKDWQYSGKADVLVTIDGHKLGLWPGISVSVHYERIYGEDVNTQGDGTFLPLNTAIAFPRLGGYEEDTSLIVTQKIGQRASLSVGKFNMLDAASRTPLLGGGGLDTFMHLGLAAPISGVTPPYLAAISASLQTKPATISLMAYDPRNAQDWEVFETLFEDGVTYSLSASVPVTIAGRKGWQNFRGVYSTEEGIDLRDVPQLALPPALRDEPRTQEEPWYFSYSFQQFLRHDPDDPSKGWGIFGQIGTSDGNPNPFKGHYFIGVGGNALIRGRTDDRWGIAYFKYKLDEDLRTASLSDLGFGLGSENGFEAYYNLAITPWFRVTANVQVVEPFPDVNEDAVFAGVRTQLRF